MEMFTSMTMPALFFAGLLVLVLLGAALYVAARLSGQRRADAERRMGPATQDTHRDQP